MSCRNFGTPLPAELQGAHGSSDETGGESSGESEHNNIVQRSHLAWAEQLATALDDGLLCRAHPTAGSELLAELSQHPAIEALLAGHLGQQTPENFLQHAQAWVAHWQSCPGGVPCCYVILDSGLPQILMHRLHLLLQVYPEANIHLSVLEPGEGFWGDLRTGRRRWDDDEDAGPLLRPFGRRVQDLHNQSIDYDWPVGGAHEHQQAAIDLCDGDDGGDDSGNCDQVSLLTYLQKLSDLGNPPSCRRPPMKVFRSTVAQHHCVKLKLLVTGF